MKPKSRPSLKSFNPLNLPRMVVNPFRNRVQFLIEAILLSGTLGRLFIAAMVVLCVAVVTGLAGYFVTFNSTQAFAHPLDAIWWAFLRLSDPGYLGDDEGALLRIISTLVTILGYVLFLGVLVAILTQGLNERIRKLEMGLTPISANKHIILLGWNHQTPAMVQKFINSEGRVNRFLARVGAKRLKLVLLVEEVHALHMQEIRNYVGKKLKAQQLIFRSGTPLRLDHLMRIDYLRASAILLPAQDRGTQQSMTRSDDAAIKTILSIANSLHLSGVEQAPPLLVVELYDPRKVSIARESYRGPIEVLAADEVISRMMAQIIRHPQISRVYQELLSDGRGNELFIQESSPKLIGQRFWDLAQTVPGALLLGVIQEEGHETVPLLNPGPEHRFKPGEKVIYIAENWIPFKPDELERIGTVSNRWPQPKKSIEAGQTKTQKILILGWSGRLPALLKEFASYKNQAYSIIVASRIPESERVDQLKSYGTKLETIEIDQLVVDYTIPDNLRSLHPESFDIVLCLKSESAESEEDADARTLVAYTILKSILSETPDHPRLVLELIDELNLGLVSAADCEHLLSPQVIGHMLVEVSLRQELNAVFQELFNSSDTEILFREILHYGLEEGTATTFAQMQNQARLHNEIALGFLRVNSDPKQPPSITINPEKNQQWELRFGDQILVLRS